MSETVSQDELARGNESSLLGVIDSMLHEKNIHESLAGPLAAVRNALVPETRQQAPFLSVILRTRGLRLEALKDALLCLAGQTDQDFEVILVDHDSEEAASADVRSIVATQPESLRERVRVVDVVGGTRSRPLNVGVREAKGEYVAVFDDDDLLFADWVEQFHRYSVEARGRILRSQAATQRSVAEIWPGGIQGFESRSWPAAEYARDFDQLHHLLVNHSPFMTMAFPRSAFTILGLEFDEELSVCEDWDLILRSSLLLGVLDVPALTAVYRRWEDVSSSYTEHSREEWARSEARVIDRLDSAPIVLPPGSVRRIRTLLAAEPAWEQLELLTNSRSWQYTAPLRVLLMEAKKLRNTIRQRVRRRT